MTYRHFLTLLDLSKEEIQQIIEHAIKLKAMQRARQPHRLLESRVLGLLFEKPSTRTKASFEAAIFHLGGHSITLSPADMHLSRGESIEDTSRVMSRIVDALVIRTLDHTRIEHFAACCTVPVINALTASHHPCQLLADIQTFVEHRGTIEGRTVAWVGDGNNVCHSFIHAAERLEFRLQLCCPPGFAPQQQILSPNKRNVHLFERPQDAISNAHLVVTDAWCSMGDEQQKTERINAFSNYQISDQLLEYAHPDAIVMHCLPAYRGEEITAEVIDGPRSVVWDEAENRLHSQKALLDFLLHAS